MHLPAFTSLSAITTMLMIIHLWRSRYNTLVKDPVMAAANAKTCEEKGLAVWPNGWCSYCELKSFSCTVFVACSSF